MNYDDFLKIPRDCPFCNPNGQVIVENELAFVTYALAPYHQDHLLVIPKRHMTEILDVDAKEEDAIYDLIRKSLKALHSVGYSDVSVLARDGGDKMKSVSHLHYNIIPNTRLGDIDHQGKKRIILSDNDAKAELEKMKKIFN